MLSSVLIEIFLLLPPPPPPVFSPPLPPPPPPSPLASYLLVSPPCGKQHMGPAVGMHWRRFWEGQGVRTSISRAVRILCRSGASRRSTFVCLSIARHSVPFWWLRGGGRGEFAGRVCVCARAFEADRVLLSVKRALV